MGEEGAGRSCGLGRVLIVGRSAPVREGGADEEDVGTGMSSRKSREGMTGCLGTAGDDTGTTGAVGGAEVAAAAALAATAEAKVGAVKEGGGGEPSAALVKGGEVDERVLGGPRGELILSCEGGRGQKPTEQVSDCGQRTMGKYDLRPGREAFKCTTRRARSRLQPFKSCSRSVLEAGQISNLDVSLRRAKGGVAMYDSVLCQNPVSRSKCHTGK